MLNVFIGVKTFVHVIGYLMMHVLIVSTIQLNNTNLNSNSPTLSETIDNLRLKQRYTKQYTEK